MPGSSLPWVVCLIYVNCVRLRIVVSNILSYHVAVIHIYPTICAQKNYVRFVLRSPSPPPAPSCLWKVYLIYVICICLRIVVSNTSWLYKLWVFHRSHKLLIPRDHLGSSPFGFWRGRGCSSLFVLCVEIFSFFRPVSCVPKVFSVSLDCPFLFAPSVFSNVYLISKRNPNP